jgi:hypothetical protein
VSPPSVEGEVKRVNPDRRFEISIGSDVVVKPDKPLEIGKAITVPDRSAQQRIEELERTLKKLIGEVESLKKERAKVAEER